jgi:hypothetical protein
MTRSRFLLALGLLSALFLAGCETTPKGAGEWQPFEGKVVYVPKFRGFWGIEARGVGKINPLSLPSTFQHDGLRIRGEVLLQPEISSAKRWGTVGEVRNLEVAQ